jgi:NADH-quinone oxidoreductase subunit N
MELWAIIPELILMVLCLALVPLAGFFHRRHPRLPAVVAALGLVACILTTLRMISWEPFTVFDGTYAIDGLGTASKLLIELGALIVLILLMSYFRGLPHVSHASVMIVFAVLGGIGLASSLDLTLIILFLQMVGMASYVMILLVRRDPNSMEASLKFFIYAAVALAVMAYGLTFLYGLTGSLSLPRIAEHLVSADTLWVGLAFSLVLIGYGFEITIVPFHFWSPDVFEGATAPISGFLSVIPKVAAFAGLTRLLIQALPEGTIHWSSVVVGAAVITMTLGNLAALRQKRLKRLLAYSSIAQAGYMLMALAVARQVDAALPAIFYYLAAYLFMNIGVFAVTAHLERTLGSDSFEAVRGLGRRAPAVSVVLTLSLLSLAGIPPLAGFLGKVLLFEAVLEGGLTWLAVFGAANMVVALFYYVRVIAELYWKVPVGDDPLPSMAGYWITYGGCLAGTLLLGIYPEPFWQIAALASRLAG